MQDVDPDSRRAGNDITAQLDRLSSLLREGTGTAGGLLLALGALAYAVYIIIVTLTSGIDVPGYASLMVAVLFLGGLQLLSLGVLGEYVGRILTETKARPLYVVRETIGGD